MGCNINGTVFDLLASGMFTQVPRSLPNLTRSDWAGAKSTAAVGANVKDDAFYAGGAERALEGADTRLERVRG